jgi:phage terminase large subunit-like protein
VPWPRLIFVASSEDQVQRTAFGRYREALKKSPLAGDYHITKERIVLLGDDGAAAGEAYPLAISPNSADGDLPTWEHIDEPHRWKMQRHHDMHDTIVENTLKDESADAWVMTTSTAGVPGEDSVEERLLEYAEAIGRGEVADASFFFHRRFCPTTWELETPEQVELAVREARGPAAEWSGDIPRIVNRYFEPGVDKQYWRRVWLNQWLKGARAGFDVQAWRSDANTKPNIAPGKGELIVLGFDGSLSQDATALIATTVHSPHQWPIGIWERPIDAGDAWEIPFDEVDAALEEAMATFDVWRFYGDPYRWREPLDRWRGRWGDKRIVMWNTTRWKATAHACRRYAVAIEEAAFTHNGDETLGRHIANARRRELKGITYEDGTPAWVLTKDRQGDFIDGAMAGLLSWEARNDAIAAGAKKRGGLVVLS